MPEVAPEDKPRPRDDDDSRGRGRGRGRRGRGRGRRDEAPVESAPEPALLEEHLEDEELPAEIHEPVAAEDDEEEISFANWTAPSWQELIAGLYRPER